MSDLAPSIVGGSQFDVTNLDENVRQISAVESTWRMPKLPDEVKLDLAAYNQLDSKQTAELLVGLDRDFAGEDEPGETPEEVPLQPAQPIVQRPRSGFDQARVIAADIFNRPAPTDPDADAVTKFKMKAIERGYLDRPEDGVVDSRWNPGLNGIIYDMAFDDYQRRIAGEDSIDSVSTRSAVDLIGEWTQPGSLLAAAADLDLVWDPKAIWNETSGWLDKWRKVGKSNGPFDFAKNMLDAVLGPVDDIAMPILTWAAVLGSGGSAAWTIAPRAFIAARGGKAGAAFLGAANRFAPTTRAGLALPSATASRLQRSSGAGRQALGGAMASWRAAEPVVTAKRALQPGIRLGVLGQAQGATDFDEAGRGVQLSQLAPVQGVQQSMRDASMSYWSLPAELLFAPQNFFNPGTFVGRGSAGATAVRQLGRLGSTPGRTAAGAVTGAAAGAWLGDDFEDTLLGAAAGGAGGLLLPKAGRALGNPNVSSVATGAVVGGLGGSVFALLDDITNDGEGGYDLWDAAIAGAAIGAVGLGAKSALLRKPGKNRLVGFVSDVAQKSEFVAVSQDQVGTRMFHEALFARSDSYREAFERSDGSFTGAWKLWQGGDDATIGAEMMSWYTQYAVHRAAKIAANAGGAIDEPNYGRYLKIREKLIGQIRSVNADQSMDGILDEVARRMANGAADPAAAARYREALAADPEKALQFVAHHNRLSSKFTKQLFAMTSYIDETSSDAAAWLRSMEQMDPAAFDEFGDYIARNIDSVGGWANYNTQMSELSRLQYDMRVLDGAHLKPINMQAGLSYEPKGGRTLIAKDDAVASDSVFQAMLADDAPIDRLNDSVDVLSGVQNPTGRTVLARKATVTGNEMEERAVRYNFYRNMYEQLDQLKPIQETIGPRLDEFDTITEHQVRGVLSAAGVDGNSRDIERLHEWARNQGVSWSQLQRKLDEVVAEDLADPEFWSRLGTDAQLRVSGHGKHSRVLDPTDPIEARTALRERARQLKSRAAHTAHEVDWERQVSDLREAGRVREADELEAFVRAADENGYKLVHGVDFVLPSDLAKMDTFHDLTRRHTNAMTIGNFFEGKLPAIARANQERRQRAAIAEKLIDAGQNISPEDDKVTRIVADVQDILIRIQDEVADSVSEIRTQNILQRTGTRLASTGTPLRAEDLGGASKVGKRLKNELRKLMYTDEEVQAIWRALPKFRNAEFRDVGLYSLEASLRERNQLAGALKWGMRGSTGAIIGGYAGAGVASSQSDEDSAGMNQLIGGAVGALVGGTIGTVAGKKGGKLIDLAERARYGYMADGLARMRDTLRFSLSPMFDLSRYTEGYMLGQAGGPLRTPDGQRFVMPFDVSPTGVRRRLKAAKGLSEADTERVWRETLDEFRAAARGDFDPQELDSAGRWFAQVGILGFNPTDWMAGAFSEFRAAGFSAEEAYKHARGMYTYGTKGRSAAEMSANFIVFPFSFQKKALTHVGDWITDDLSRAWLLHDGFKAYEALSEQFNLDEVWREHLPALQQLRRLNMFAYGVSPGQWGGVNARILEPAAKMGSELSAQLFAPQAFQIGGEGGIDWGKVGSAAEIQDLYKSLIPAINDMNWMIANAKDQAEVALSPTHQTRRASISSAWQEWNDFKRAKEEELESYGADWAEMQRSPIFADHRSQVMAFRANLDSKYPHWQESYSAAIANSIALDMERTDRVTRVTQGLDTATPMDQALLAMDAAVEQERLNLQATGYDTGGRFTWVDAPVESHNRVKALAVEYLRQDRRFGLIWDKFFADQFGPIESEV